MFLEPVSLQHSSPDLSDKVAIGKISGFTAFKKADPKPDCEYTTTPEVDDFLQTVWKGKISNAQIVNSEKSIADPTQEIEFLGFVIISRPMTPAVTKEKLKSLTSHARTYWNLNT